MPLFGLESLPFFAGVVGVVVSRRERQSGTLVGVFKWTVLMIFTLGFATFFVTMLYVLANGEDALTMSAFRRVWTPLTNSVVAVAIGLPTYLVAVRASKLYESVANAGLQVQLSESLPLLGGRKK